MNSPTYWGIRDDDRLVVTRDGQERGISLWAECGSMYAGGLVDLLRLLSPETLEAVMAEIGAYAFDHSEWVHRRFDEQQAASARQMAERNAARRAERLRLIGQGDLTCRACGASEDLVIDHIHPRSRGGSNDLSNLQLLCGPCNGSKGAKTMAEWLGTWV